MKLKDKVAIVTGAGSGIGEATAKLFAQEGAKVVVADVNDESIKRVAQDIKAAGGQSVAVKVDISQRQDVENMVEEAIKQFGQIDILINNAGVYRDSMSWKMTDEQWDLVLRVNLTGTFLCSRAVIPHMRAKSYGKIVNTSSISCLGNPGQANYSSSKAGIIALTKTLALELARGNINVNCVAPGGINTPMIQNMPEDAQQKIQEGVPLRRLGDPNDVAKLHVFLASDDSNYITGQVVFIDGGVSVGV